MMINNAHTLLRFLIVWMCLLLAVTGATAQQEGVKLGHQARRSELVPSGYGYDIQKTSTLQQTVYAEPGGKPRRIKLPPYRNGAASPTSVYTRWYDYETDEWAYNLNVLSNSGRRFYKSGHFFLNNANLDLQEAEVALPVGKDRYVVACDVSSYNNYEMSGNLFINEPTLSYRTIFEVRDANQIASRFKTLKANEFLENVEIHMPNSVLGKENPRAMLNFDLDNYFFYLGDENLLLSSFRVGGNFATERVVSGVQQRITRNIKNVDVIRSGGDIVDWQRKERFIFIKPMVAKEPKVLELQLECRYSTKVEELRKGEWVEISDQEESAHYNLARFTVYFESELPEHYSMNADDFRSLRYLDNNYVLLAKQDFDMDTDPVTKANNCGMTPIELNDCTYGFVYPINSRKIQNGNKVAQWNEYGFYKTAEVAGISKSGMSQWKWYNNGNPVYDRAYYESEGRKNGYFMYIDASNMPGTVAKLRFDDPLCAGTKLIVSAGVCSLTAGNDSDGDVTFIFKGVDSDNNETVLHRYTSGDIPKVKNLKGEYGGKNGKEWYQVYYSFSYSSEVEYKSYLLQVENSASNTAGGDYAIDDIRVYRSKPAVRAAQENLPCDIINEKPSVRVRVGFDKLVESLSRQEENTGENIVLRYQFLDSNKSPLEGYDYKTGKDYGVISFNTTFDNMGTDIPETTGDEKLLAGAETLEIAGELTRFIAFKVPNAATLKYGESYYVVIANSDGVFDKGTCALISDIFRILPPSEITVDGEGVTDARGLCYGTPVELTARIYDRINLTPVDCSFDWYIGEDFSTLSVALQHYRSVYSTPRADEHELKKASGIFTEADYALLRQVVDKKQFYLNYSKITRRVTRGETILAVPIEGSIAGDVTICPDAIRLNTDAESDMPTLSLGLTEPAVLRMSIEQFEELRKGNILRLNVFDFKNADGTRNHSLVKIDGNTSVMMYATSDTHYTVDPGVLESWAADLQTMEVKQGGDNYILLNFKSTTETSQLTVREGYTYWLTFDFQEQIPDGEASVCNGLAKFGIRIVPKYLTWTGKEGDNWNNDNNWKRSTKNEIYKEDYEDDSDSQGFVPLDFSLATVANTVKAPWLCTLTKDSEGLENIAQSGNYIDGSNLPTDGIALEQVVLKKNGAGYVYGVVPFYGNTCNEVYFKSGAEMRNAERLKYNKAWVDFELTAGRWYMLASPLQEVVAGDMYLPVFTARQETEAFKDILYDKENNNRFNPAVYQRSWDKSGSTVIYNGGQPSTDAFISADWSRAYNKVDEVYPVGHCFSIRPVASEAEQVLFRLPKADREYLYYSFDNVAEGNATAISRDAAQTGRLVMPDNEGRVVVKATNTTDDNRFFILGNPFMATLDMAAFFKANTQLEPKFWMITENGQASTIFDENGDFVSTDVALGTTLAPMQGFFVEAKNGSVTRSIKSPDVVFTTDMTVAKPSNGTLLRTVRTRTAESETVGNSLRIKAERNGLGNTILIKCREEADDSYCSREDVASLMDSNLEDLPTLYSVAGNQAVSINVLNHWKMIPLGVYSKDETEVKLTFRGIDALGTELKLYDAELNTYTALTEDTEIYVAGNTHGRYFITHNVTATDEPNTDASFAVYSPQPQRLVVTSVPADPLRQIEVYTVSGVLVKSLTGLNGVSEELELPGDMYVVKVKSRNNQTAEKVRVRP